MDFQFSFITLDNSVAPNRNMGYPQVHGSIPAENPRTQIHMHFIEYTLNQGFWF